MNPAGRMAVFTIRLPAVYGRVGLGRFNAISFAAFAQEKFARLLPAKDRTLKAPGAK
jgi:hypothetical protein